ncbi:hypothetical protein JCM11641_004746 [Rhodosporidiobolus odoratus]
MAEPPVKRRITRACDFCNRRGLKCVKDDTASSTASCRSCQHHAVTCTYNRPRKKRGPTPRTTDSTVSEASTSQETSAPGAISAANLPPTPLPPAAYCWRPSRLVPVFALLRALETYYEAVYPIFPFFIWPAFIDRVKNEDHLNNRSFYGTVMAASALGAARLRDSAGSTTPLSAKEAAALPSPELLLAAAEDAIPADLETASDFDLIRSTALLAVCAIQLAQTKKMYRHSGVFWTLVSMHRLHDEKNWNVVNRLEMEERRRVFWSMYTLELFACLAFGGVRRTKESALKVLYPTEIDDTFLARGVEQPAGSISWLHGWNFTTQLYKMLECAMDASQPGIVCGASSQISFSALLDFLDTCYACLASAFKEIKPSLGVPDLDRFGYQAANILVTSQTVRMVAVCRKAQEASQREEAVRTAEDTLRQVNAIPIAYLQGFSSPLIHHLVGMYKLLFPVTERRLTPDLFVRIRQLLIDTTTLLNRLQSRLTYTIDITQRFTSQIKRMDEAQAIAASRPTSPRPQPQAPPSPSSDALDSTAAPAFSTGFTPTSTSGIPPWEAAFELQDIFSDWPFDFSSSEQADKHAGFAYNPILLQYWRGETVDPGRVAIVEAGLGAMDLVLYNTQGADHPLHLHNIRMFILGRGTGAPNTTALAAQNFNTTNPIRRDTIGVSPGTWVLARLVTDIVGVHAFQAVGLLGALVVQPEAIPDLPIPQKSFDLCIGGNGSIIDPGRKRSFDLPTLPAAPVDIAVPVKTALPFASKAKKSLSGWWSTD